MGTEEALARSVPVACKWRSSAMRDYTCLPLLFACSDKNAIDVLTLWQYHQLPARWEKSLHRHT